MGEGVWDRLRQLEEEASKKGVRLEVVSGLDFAIMHSCMRCLIAFARVLAQSAGGSCEELGLCVYICVYWWCIYSSPFFELFPVFPFPLLQRLLTSREAVRTWRPDYAYR